MPSARVTAELWLSNNQIADEGMKAFASAIASGSLPACEMMNFTVRMSSSLTIHASTAQELFGFFFTFQK